MNLVSIESIVIWPREVATSILLVIMEDMSRKLLFDCSSFQHNMAKESYEKQFERNGLAQTEDKHVCRFRLLLLLITIAVKPTLCMFSVIIE